MTIKIDELGLDRVSLQKLLLENPGRLKLRLGDGKIIELLDEHLQNGIDPGDIGKVVTDDHDRVQVKDNSGFDKVRSQHDKTGKSLQDKFGQLADPGNGVC